MSSRKRSRWGSSSDNNNNNKGENSQQHVADVVSDQEAVHALLSSAAAAAASVSSQLQQQQQKGGGGRGGGRGSGGPRQERRSGDGGGVDGHYGPQRGEHGRNDNYKNVKNDDDIPQDLKRSRWSSSDRPAQGSGGSDRAARLAASATAGNGSDGVAAVAATAAATKSGDTAPAVVEKEKPNFGLSGALAKKDSGGGGSNMYKGVLLKFREPPEARAPANTYWRLYVFKGQEELETLHIAKQSAYLIGRNADICDIVIQHPSASSQHAVIQYRALPNKTTGKLQCLPYLIDLESTNGCFINGVRIDAARYYQLKKGDVLRFGASTREYVLLTANATSIK